MSRDGGWIFVDVLVALGVLAVALSFLAPAVAGLGRLQLGQESRVFASMEAGLDDPWAKLR
jgi:hypothetical protein